MTRESIRRQITNLSKQANRQAIHYAYLAEDYDGIGQYVKVGFARSSTSVGMTARVASGDYGTGQVIPAGTRVAIFSNRGRIEILSLGAK